MLAAHSPTVRYGASASPEKLPLLITSQTPLTPSPAPTTTTTAANPPHLGSSDAYNTSSSKKNVKETFTQGTPLFHHNRNNEVIANQTPSSQVQSPKTSRPKQPRPRPSYPPSPPRARRPLRAPPPARTSRTTTRSSGRCSAGRTRARRPWPTLRL